MSAWLMASPGGRSGEGTCFWRVRWRWEHTWARLGASSAPKSILTPLKRLSASMALQCNYPVGNDISTQFLPACSLAGQQPAPSGQWMGDFVDHAGLRAVDRGLLRAERWTSFGATLVRELLLSDHRGYGEAVPQWDWMWCNSASCQDNWFLSSNWRGYPLKASGFND